CMLLFCFLFSSRRRHTRFSRDWSSDVCSSDLERFAARLKDKTNPIHDDQMSDVIIWLLEENGMRPTRPSQDSSDGSASPESGTSSTESTPPEAPTSPTSQPTDS